jgi:hypothetical protein
MNEMEDTSKSNDKIDKMYIDPTWNGIYKLGGISMLAFGLIYIIASIFNMKLAVPPNDTMAFF